MHSFGRPLIVRLCFSVKLIHREIVLEMDNATGDSKQQEKAASSSQRLSLEDTAGLTNRRQAAHVPGLKTSAVVCKHSEEVSDYLQKLERLLSIIQ